MNLPRLRPIAISLLGAIVFGFTAQDAVAQEQSLPADVSTWGQSWSRSYGGNWPPHAVRAVGAQDGAPVRLGRLSARFELRPRDARGDDGWGQYDRHRWELGEASGLERDGQEHWYAFSIFVPDNHPAPPASITLGQFHEVDVLARFLFQWTAKGYGLLNRVETSLGESSILIPQEEFQGRWHDILMHVRWSDENDGFFRVWVNHNLAYDHRGRTMRVNGSRARFQFGVYRTSISIYYGNVPTEVVYFDELHSGQQAHQADRVGVSQVQQILSREGLYKMAIDGLWGPGTLRAANAFLENSGADPIDAYDPEVRQIIVEGSSP